MTSFLDYFAALHLHPGAYEGGEGGEPDAHARAGRKLFEDSLHFMEGIELAPSAAVLDVGMGYGFHCDYFARKGCEVTGITAHLTEDVVRRAEASRYRARQMDMHFLDAEDERFDLVWSHHSLEHSFSPLLCLREWYRVLKKGGCLAVTVPPHKQEVVSGHFTTGWNVGQLIYLLGVAGFNIKEGYFVEEKYNVRALVRRPHLQINPDGLSWICNLREHLPVCLRDNLHDAPASLGRYSFSGNLQMVARENCVERKEHAPAGPVRRSFRELWRRIVP